MYEWMFDVNDRLLVQYLSRRVYSSAQLICGSTRTCCSIINLFDFLLHYILCSE